MVIDRENASKGWFAIGTMAASASARFVVVHTKMHIFTFLAALFTYLLSGVNALTSATPYLQFTKDLPNEVEFSNSTGVAIFCATEGHPSVLSVSWEHVDGTTVSNISGLRQILPDGSLQLLPFRSEDFRQDVHMGIYRCRATSSIGSIISADLHLRAMMGVEYESSVYDVFAIKGNMAVIRCHVPTMLQNYVSVDAFIRDDTLKITAHAEPEGKYFLSPTGVLYIRDVELNDAIRGFRCQTINRLTKETRISSNSGKLFVTEPQGNISPKIVDSSTLVPAEEGKTVTIPCVSQGWPKPIAKWSKISKSAEIPVLIDNLRIKTNSIGLVISNVKQTDSGDYVCRVSNEAGVDQTETNLKISAPLAVKVHPVFQEIDLVKKAFRLECTISGYPIKSFWWSKNGKQVLFDKTLSPEGKNVLFLNAASSEDKGVYQCFAQNDFQAVHSSAVVDLGLFPPSFQNTFRDTTIQPGSPASLECEATGNPPPQINWYLDGITLTSGGHLVVDESVTNNGPISSILSIKRTKVEDGGLYSCSATNKAGEVRHEARLNIYGPLGSRSVPKVVAIVGQNSYLNCPIYGFPVKRITWKMGDVSLPQMLHQQAFTNGTLLLRNVQRAQDSGEYQCFASNNEGQKVASTVQVAIMVMPKIMPFSFQEDLLREGMRAQLQCVVTEGDPPITISWSKDGLPIPLELDVSVRDVDQFSSIMAIRTITPRHNGNYTCAARNAIGMVTLSARLAVNVPPKITPFVFQDDQNFKGMRAHIVCAVSRGDIPLRFQWLKDSKDLTQSHSSLNINIASVDKYSSSLSIESVSSKHSGNYTCRVSNDAGEASYTAQLLVQVSPRIVPFSFQSDQMLEGALARTTCVVYQGDLPLEITWLKDDRPIVDDFIEIRVVDDYTSILTISKVQNSHSGRYTCVAKNAAATATHTAELEVKVPPKIVAFSFQEDELVEGMYTRVSCVVSRGDLPIEIWWTKNNFPISLDSSTDIDIRKMDEFTSVLSIDRLSPHHNGNYTCYAKNDAAITSFAASLTVNVPPQWKHLPDKDIIVLEGDRVLSNCQAAGYPTPRIIWMRRFGADENIIEEEIRNDTVVNVFPNGTLLIPKAVGSLEGSYYCSASNGVGRPLTTALHLQIQKPAKINSPSGNHTSKRGEDAILKCEATGNKPLHFTWFAGGKQLPDPKFTRYDTKQQNSNGKVISELHIEKTGKADSIEFMCLAKNDFGESSSKMWLVVQGRPDPPHGVKAVERGNRSVEVTWFIPFDGNSPLIRFVIEHNEKGGIPKSQTVSGRSTGLILKELKPSTSYQISVAAENDIGRSEAEGVAEITLSGETPSGIPQEISLSAINSRSIKVSWMPPPVHSWNGNIRGYYVGYREANSQLVYNFKMLEVPEGYKKGLSSQLSDLKEFTRYAIVVQAFNDYGKGPLSEEFLIMTSEDVPRHPPTDVSCFATGPESISVSWSPPPSTQIHGILRGYRVIYWPVASWDGNIIFKKWNTTSTTAILRTLDRFTNYSIQVTAHTMAGDGAASHPIYCQTAEDVPSRPLEIKAFPSSEESVIVVWRPPAKRNGKIIHYTAYVDQSTGGRKSSRKHILQANGNYYEVRNLQKLPYTFSVTASTSVGEGEMSMQVISAPGDINIPAKCAAFHSTIRHAIATQLQLLCPMTGNPLPQRTWFYRGQQLFVNEHMKLQMDGSLHVDKLQLSDAGNYTCMVANNLGRDQITYTVVVQVPPNSPALYAVATTQTSITLRWKTKQDDENNIQGYTLYYQHDSSNWATIDLQPYQENHIIENLECGTKYYIYMLAFNKIGVGQSSEKITVTTSGGAPRIPPLRELISESTHHATLALKSWIPDECPILRFVIEYKRQHGKIWHSVAHDTASDKQQIDIKDLESGTWYSLRMTAYTAVNSTVANYNFQTQAAETGKTNDKENIQNDTVLNQFDINVVLIVSMSIIAFVIICVTVACLWMKRMRRVTARDGVSGNQGQASLLLQTPRSSVSRPDARKSVTNSRPMSGYDDDIVPYATAKLSDFDQSHPAAQSMPFLGPGQGNIPTNSYNPSAPPFSESYVLYGMARAKHGPIGDRTLPGCSRQRNSNQARGSHETKFMYPSIPSTADGDYDPPPPDLSWLPMKHA